MAVRSTGTFDSQRGASPVPAFGLVLPFDDRLSFGIGAYGIAGMGVDYGQNLYGGTTSSSYSMMRFAPACARSACSAFVIRLSTTCCSWKASAHVGGRAGSSSVTTSTCCVRSM